MKEALRESLANYDLDFLHASDLPPGVPLGERIAAVLATADVVIADISGSNPNVLFEVGLAIGRGLPVLLLAEKGATIPAGLASTRVVYFEQDKRSQPELVDHVRSALLRILNLTGKTQATETGARVAGLSGHRNPFEGLAAENLKTDDLLRLFVEPPYFRIVNQPTTVVIEGQRGCGKTTLLRMMTARNVLRLGHSHVAGFYLNLNRAVHFVGSRRSVLASPQRFLLYVNLLFLQSVVNELVPLRDGHIISAREEEQLLAAFSERFPAGLRFTTSLGRLSDALTQSIYGLSSGEANAVSSSHVFSSASFLDWVSEVLRQSLQPFSEVLPAYLLDDYATDWLSEELVATLNRVLFQHSGNCCFKIATIAGRQPLSLGVGRVAEEARDFVLVSMHTATRQRDRPAVMEFTRRVINRRLAMSGSPMQADALFEARVGTKGKHSYAGLATLTALCADDCGSLLSLCQGMIRQAKGYDKPIPVKVQDRVVREQSLRVLQGMQYRPGAEYAALFLRATMQFLKHCATSKRRLSAPAGKALPIYSGISIRKPAELTSGDRDKLLFLVRVGVMHPAFTPGKVHEEQRFVLAKMFFPAFGLPVSWSERFLEVKPVEATELLRDPQSFWRRTQRTLHN